MDESTNENNNQVRIEHAQHTHNGAESVAENNKDAKSKKNLPIGAVIKTLVAVLILAGLGLGGFYANKYVKKVNSDLSDIKNDLSQSTGKLSALDEYAKMNSGRIDALVTAQTTTSQANYNIPAPTYAGLSVEKVLEDKNSSLESGFRFLLVDVKLTNSSSTDIYFSPSELKLKDSDNYEYSFYGNTPYGKDYIKQDAKVLLPDNRLPLDYASLKPGESVKGTIVFVLNRPGTKFSLIRNGSVLKDITL